jgi:hypothetical protein
MSNLQAQVTASRDAFHVEGYETASSLSTTLSWRGAIALINVR